LAVELDGVGHELRECGTIAGQELPADGVVALEEAARAASSAEGVGRPRQVPSRRMMLIMRKPLLESVAVRGREMQLTSALATAPLALSFSDWRAWSATAGMVVKEVA
jgi:hypothetical protein